MFLIFFLIYQSAILLVPNVITILSSLMAKLLHGKLSLDVPFTLWLLGPLIAQNLARVASLLNGLDDNMLIRPNSLNKQESSVYIPFCQIPIMITKRATIVISMNWAEAEHVQIGWQDVKWFSSTPNKGQKYIRMLYYDLKCSWVRKLLAGGNCLSYRLWFIIVGVYLTTWSMNLKMLPFLK